MSKINIRCIGYATAMLSSILLHRILLTILSHCDLTPDHDFNLRFARTSITF
jgi:hypothetical protein